MQIETAILAPAAVLAGWTMIVFLWLIARRMPAFAAAGITVGSMPAGARGVDTEAQLSTKANWISHNYTHLMEQPTVFYPVVIMLALMGDLAPFLEHGQATFHDETMELHWFDDGFDENESGPVVPTPGLEPGTP